MEKISIIFVYFLIYAFLGYICEVIYVAICTKKITNRGYLLGPLVPIYGVGALLIIFPLDKLYNYWFLVLILGILITSTLEYLVSYFMELIFHMRWWDYSDKFLNLNGRICLRNSSMFGALVMLVIYGLHPIVKNLVFKLFNHEILSYILVSLALLLFIIDFIFSTIKHVKLSRIIKKLDEIYNNIKIKTDEFRKEAKNNLLEFMNKKNIVRKLKNIKLHYPSFKFRNRKTKENLNINDIENKLEDYINE